MIFERADFGPPFFVSRDGAIARRRLDDPRNDRARLVLAEALSKDEAWTAAIAALEGIDPRGAFAHRAAIVRIGLLAEADRQGEALMLAQGLATAKQSTVEDWQVYADQLIAAKRPADAAPWYQRVTQSDPALPWAAWLQYGGALDQGGGKGEGDGGRGKGGGIRPDEAAAVLYMGVVPGGGGAGEGGTPGPQEPAGEAGARGGVPHPSSGLGRFLNPARITAINDWAKEHGAAFEDVGNWRRAHYFPRPGEDMHAAVNRECVAVRGGVGIFDASTLGKIEVVGPDAAEFMNRFFVNAWTKLGVGKCRYGVLLREDGFVLDDGVVGRLAADRFHATTTTGGAARVLNMMEDYLQTEWPNLNVWLTSTTEQWSVIAVQGPRAREVIAPLIEGLDVSAEAFPHMSIADARSCGVPMRLMRVSFTGELGFEVNVPSGYGRMVWEAIWERGKTCDMVAYGTETMHVLRAEKGYIIVGQETDGTVTPDDVRTNNRQRPGSVKGVPSRA